MTHGNRAIGDGVICFTVLFDMITLHSRSYTSPTWSCPSRGSHEVIISPGGLPVEIICG